MRLIAVPLARASRATTTAATSSSSSSSRLPIPICTYIVQLPPPPTTTPGSPTTPAKLPLSTRLLNKASDFWLSLGKDGTEPGKKLAVFDWKRRTYAAGEKLMDRIEYQEWALKGVDPALGPGLRPGTTRESGEGNTASGSSSKEDGNDMGVPSPSRPTTLPLLYPASLVQPQSLLRSLTHLTTHRTPHHRQRLIYCVLGMPLTIPFALVPIVPNLPFFYLVWRAWSHWKAWKASEYLGRLLDGGRVELRECEEVEGAFRVAKDATPTATSTKEGQGSLTATTTATAADSRVEILLTPSRIDELARRLNLDEQPVLELRRALQQTRLAEEKGELKRVIEEEERAATGGFKEDGEGSRVGEEKEEKKDR